VILENKISVLKQTLRIADEYVSRANKIAFELAEPAPSASTNSARDAITPLVVRAVETDGGHHKQWYLEAIAEALQIELPPHDLGIAP
jgi:hypothetical protein